MSTLIKKLGSAKNDLWANLLMCLGLIPLPRRKKKEYKKIIERPPLSSLVDFFIEKLVLS